jgi:hypothetical protein
LSKVSAERRQTERGRSSGCQNHERIGAVRHSR